LGDFYGGVPHSVREIYVGELGWFDGDPTSLAPLHPKESSTRYIELMGGRDTVLAHANRAARANDHQWAAELFRHLVRVDPADTQARAGKAEALRRIGYTTTNSNWRNWYLTAAHELDGTIDYTLALNINAPDQAAAFPPEAVLESFRFRLDPDKVDGITTTIGVTVTDYQQDFGITIRNGIVEVTPSLPTDATTVITAPKMVLLGMVFTDLVDALTKATEAGAATVTDPAAATTFLSYFDPKNTTPITLSDR